MDNWWKKLDKERSNMSGKSIRIFPPDLDKPTYKRDIFILDYVDRLTTRKTDPVYDAMKLYNQIKRKQVALSRRVKIKKILG